MHELNDAAIHHSYDTFDSFTQRIIAKHARDVDKSSYSDTKCTIHCNLIFDTLPILLKI